MTEEPKTTQNGVLAEDEDLEAQLAYENLKRRREARRRKRIIIIVVIVVAILAAAIWFFASHANQEEDEGEVDPLAVSTAVYRDDFSTTVSANGATEPLKSTVVTPEVDGIIENVSVEEGSHVNKGDVLFTIKNESLDKAVREAENKVKSSERAIDQSNQAVDEAYKAYNDAVDECNESGDWSTFDEASLRGAITSAESDYEDAKDNLQSDQDALKEAQAEADKRIVRAPVSGNVVSMNAVNGAAVGSESSSSGSGSLMQISDLSQMKVTVQVNEVDISNIKVGQVAEATFAALPDVELDAEVKRIASTASGADEEGMGGGGVVTYSVDLIIPHPDKNLKPGMTATVTITTQFVENALIVPVTALMGDDEDQYVTVVDDAEKGKTHDVTVTVIERNSSEAAVKGDLKEGDMVLMGGSADDSDVIGDEMLESEDFEMME
ncbi:MAG: efflux RND transporter periplasmic adaptor subunit [Atopobiaceae bacterium]|nr:efflux RND transporter periplasmic adaptor subunit [Atopobiaceae bacterium]